MTTVNIHQAKTHLSQLIDAAMQGEETIITKAGKPAARLCPLAEKNKPKPIFGVLKGRIKIAEDFDESLSANIFV